jgi:glutamate/tyrosine decarboxylase-like PLP-dependent enzyme
MNANVGGRDHGAVYVERQVIEWCRELFGLPVGASGLVVSGTSMATLIGLTVARNERAGHDVRREGLGANGARLTAYASAEAHGSVARALEILGLGRESLRAVPVDDGLRMDVGVLNDTIDEDLAAGRRPFCVVATAGTVNTGAIDDLAPIAEVCADKELWLHVDGAFGGLAMLSERLRARLAGIEKADSIAFDFHKWMHVPYDAGCILIRDARAHRKAFSARQDYLAGSSRGLAGGSPWFCEYGPELSRGFRALKVWFTLKEHGVRRLGAKIEENCRQAQYLAERVTAAPALELMAPVDLNIVCFRFSPPGARTGDLDRINEDIVADLQENGVAAPSTTRLGGALVIRVSLTNHRSRIADLDVLIDSILELGAARASEHSQARRPRSAGIASRS